MKCKICDKEFEENDQSKCLKEKGLKTITECAKRRKLCPPQAKILENEVFDNKNFLSLFHGGMGFKELRGHIPLMRVAYSYFHKILA